MTSPFDEMLAETQRQMDELSGTGRGHRPSSTGQNGTGIGRPGPSSRPPATTEKPSAAASQTFDSNLAHSDAIRFLNDRYGNRWRHEVTERRRDGDEVIVLCTLFIDDLGVAKSQFGQARVAGTSPRGTASGQAGGRAAGGVSFSIGGAPANGDAVDDPEDAAYRSAIGQALAKCAEML